MTSTLSLLRSHLQGVLNRHRPDFVFYLAGADPFEGDRLGRLKMTIDGLKRRDEIVMEACAKARLPVAISMSGGYAHRHRRHRHHSREYDTSRRNPMSQHFRLLTEQQVHSLLPMPDLIAAMESALAKFSARDVLQPIRTVLTVGPTKAYFGLMPAYIPAPASLGAKLVTVFGENHKRDLPSHLATIVLLDPETGALQAIMDGRYITEARTAAVSAVSTRFLARPDASTLAIIGSGVQARSHLEAYQLVRQLKQVRIWSPKQRSREQFVEDMSGHVAAPIVARGHPRSRGARR